MRAFLIIILSITLFIGCTSSADETVQTTPEGTFFGEPFELSGVVDLASILDTLTEEESDLVRIEGRVVEVCQSKGCWMTLESEYDTNVRVTFYDYAFFVPKDMAGSTIIAEGRAWKEVKTVAMLRHYAEDAGITPEGVASITEDQVEFLFEATGVFLP